MPACAAVAVACSIDEWGLQMSLICLLVNADDDVLADYGVHQCVGLGGKLVQAGAGNRASGQHHRGRSGFDLESDRRRHRPVIRGTPDRHAIGGGSNKTFGVFVYFDQWGRIQVSVMGDLIFDVVTGRLQLCLYRFSGVRRSDDRQRWGIQREGGYPMRDEQIAKVADAVAVQMS